MTGLSSDTILAVFAIFCRIGGCLLVIPGYSSAMIPVRARIFIAFAVSVALSPLLLDTVVVKIGDGSPGAMLSLILAETFTGFLIGFIGRLFFAALQMIGVAITQAIGFGGIPGTVIDENEQMPTITTLFTMTATVLLFVTGMHWEVLRGLVDSYDAIPPGAGVAPRLALVNVTDQATAAFVLALRIGSPFLIYSILVNFAVGLTNKLTPQIPVYFIAMPFVTAGGMILLFFVVNEFITAFMAGFGAWLTGL